MTAAAKAKRPPADVWTPAMRNALRWPVRLSVSEWADRNIVLGADSAEPGPYRTDRTPYVREWQDSASVPWVRQITIQKSTQVGGSVALLNVLAYAITEDPGPITWVMPTREDAAEFGENRVMPMVDLSSALRAQLTPDRWDAKKRQIRFRRCRLLFRSARVAKELAQYSARWLFGDEAGKWPTWTQKESGPWDLAMERVRTFWNHKAYLNSTPTLPDGLITSEFMRGDQRRYHMPCPHCTAFQPLTWSQVKWPETVKTEAQMKVVREAWYECASCHGRILDEHKQTMLTAGVWVPHGWGAADWRARGAAGDRETHRSYHIWAGYSPWLGWWQIVQRFLKAKSDPSLMMGFVNSWLGEPWQQVAETTTDTALLACQTKDLIGNAPAWVRVITAAVDVQKEYLEYSVQGWGPGLNTMLLATGRVKSWDRLTDEVMKPQWGANKLAVRLCVIDSRHRRDEVMAWARRHGVRVRMIAGVTRDSASMFDVTRIDRHPVTGQPLPDSPTVWTVNVPLFKDMAWASIMRATKAPDEKTGRMFLPADTPREYLEQMIAEHKVIVARGGRVKEVWDLKPGRERNEAWDLTVYNLATAHMIGVHKMPDGAPTTAAARPAAPARRQDDDEEGHRLWRRTT